MSPKNKKMEISFISSIHSKESTLQHDSDEERIPEMDITFADPQSAREPTFVESPRKEDQTVANASVSR